jgi:cellulose biosynthesis protein BcsQ
MSKRDYRVWLIAILKGGARKTTTAMFLAFALAKLGFEVLVIDADSKTQGVSDWASRVYGVDQDELPFHVYSWDHTSGLLVQFVQVKQKETGAQIVLIDIGGEAPEVLGQAALLADEVISPVGAEQGEMSRLEPTVAMIKGKARRHRLLLTRVPKVGQGAAAEARAQFVVDGYEVLETEIPQNRELYAKPWGHVPADNGAYDDLAAELDKAA